MHCKPQPLNLKFLESTDKLYKKFTCKNMICSNLYNVDSLTTDMDNLILKSKTKHTWEKHSTAWKLYHNFCEDNRVLAWPATKEIVRAFVAWALSYKRLKTSTVKSYVSSVSVANSLAGYTEAPLLRDDIIKMLIKGGENSSLLGTTHARIKLPLDPFTLKLLGHRISSAEWSIFSKQIVWTAFVTCFFSSCRMGELLAEKENSFDPKTTLKWEHVNFDFEDGALVFIPYTKTKGVVGEYLDLFSYENSCYCPVTNLLRLKNMLEKENALCDSNPVFMFRSGRLLTKNKLNSILEQFLGDLFDEKRFKITCHSLRTAIPTLVDVIENCEKNCEIKEWGRWSSDAFRVYTKNVRAKRKLIFEKIADVLSNIL